MNKKQKEFKVILTLALFICLVGIIVSQYNVTRLKKSGVFVVGKLYKRTPSGKNSGGLFYKYNYKNKEYTYIMTAGVSPNIDSFKYFIILPQNPKIVRRVEEHDVPWCIELSNMPSEGWKEIPDETCN